MTYIISNSVELLYFLRDWKMDIKVAFLTIISLAIFCTNAAGTDIYVDDDANGLNNGSSWENAYTSLQDALAGTQYVVKPVDIYIAKGIYKPDQGAGITPGDREATFNLINNISLYGGYAGLGNTDPNARDIELYETILSGDLNNDDINNPDTSTLFYEQSRTDNSYRVITSRSIRNINTIDGLTIMSGNANDSSCQTGSGLYNYYSDLKVKNCTFKENSAVNGAGVYNYSDNPSFKNCKFINNMADNNGGGIYNDSSNVTFTDCIISGNAANDGSGIYNCQGIPVLTDCTFSSNMSTNEGGGIFNYKSNSKITDCLFNSNQAKHGAGICNSNYSESIITDCSFSENSAENNGGGIYNNSSDHRISSCTFENNYASNGGGMYNYKSDPEIKHCSFNKNSVESSGGGIFNSNNSYPEIENCTFSENFSDNSGSGMSNSNSKPTIISCTFFNNTSEISGGGIYNLNSQPTLNNCTLNMNHSVNGGSMYNYNSAPIMTDCSIFGNTSVYGAGIYNSNNSNPTITICAFMINTAEDSGGGMFNDTNSKPNLNGCIFINNSAQNNGGGMYNSSSFPILTDCTFSENISNNNGGGMYNNQSNPSMTNCTFRSNSAEDSGGGLYNESSNISSTKTCTFIENSAKISGGAIQNDKCNATLPNLLFLGNSALYGGGINNIDNSKITVLNCIFENNLSPYGNAVSCFSSTEPEDNTTPCNVQLTNCILWDENEEIFNEGNSTITVSYCDVKGGQSNVIDPNGDIIWDDNNIEADPCFIVPGYWNLNQTPEDVNDDFYIEGEYHLKSQAGRFDPVSQNWVTDDVTSDCIDAGDPIIPLYYEMSPNGNRINIGIYGGTMEASKSLYNINYFNQAYSPEPAHYSAGIILDTLMQWVSDSNVIAHELYFGTDTFPPYFRTQYDTVFDPGALSPFTQYYWRIDNIDNSMNRVSGDIWTFKTGDIPDYPYNPNPRSGTENVEHDITLTWNQSDSFYYSRIYYFDLYLGTDYNDVYNATYDNPLDVLEFSSNYYYMYDTNSYSPANLKLNQKYYWRIDEGTRPSWYDSEKIKGKIWNFTTGSEPAHAYYPYPENNAEGVSPNGDTILSWSPGTFNPVSYDVYLGNNFDDVNNATIETPLNCLFSIAQDANYYNPGRLYMPICYWRIDQQDCNGVVLKGKIWSFSTYFKSRSCFPADTPVWVDGKMREISKVTAGQEIGNSDCTISTSGSVKGLEIHNEGINPCYEMTLESGNTITIVHSHYFKTTSGQWKKIEELSSGMKLQSMNGPITIKSVTKKEKPFLGKSYNLITKDSEQYFVGKDGVVALDCSKKLWEELEEARK